jgi:hypothetical protein
MKRAVYRTRKDTSKSIISSWTPTFLRLADIIEESSKFELGDVVSRHEACDTERPCGGIMLRLEGSALVDVDSED